MAAANKKLQVNQMNLISEAILSCLLFFLLQFPIRNVYILLFVFGALKRILLGSPPSIGQVLFEGLFYLSSVFVLPNSLSSRIVYIFVTTLSFGLFKKFVHF
jgi:hypothetical protein